MTGLAWMTLGAVAVTAGLLLTVFLCPPFLGLIVDIADVIAW